MARNSRDDVIAAAGRLFADRGYHGTSMRDLGTELGLLGSSLYSHVESKKELLIEVIRRGAGFFQESADRALAVDGSPYQRLTAFVGGHLDVILDHRDEVRTFLNEARFLDAGDRGAALDLRDRYEASLRTILRQGAADGTFRADLDPALASIVALSVLNAVERWYRADGRLDRDGLVVEITDFIAASLC